MFTGFNYLVAERSILQVSLQPRYAVNDDLTNFNPTSLLIPIASHTAASPCHFVQNSHYQRTAVERRRSSFLLRMSIAEHLHCSFYIKQNLFLRSTMITGHFIEPFPPSTTKAVFSYLLSFSMLNPLERNIAAVQNSWAYFTRRIASVQDITRIFLLLEHTSLMPQGFIYISLLVPERSQISYCEEGGRGKHDHMINTVQQKYNNIQLLAMEILLFLSIHLPH